MGCSKSVPETLCNCSCNQWFSSSCQERAGSGLNEDRGSAALPPQARSGDMSCKALGAGACLVPRMLFPPGQSEKRAIYFLCFQSCFFVLLWGNIKGTRASPISLFIPLQASDLQRLLIKRNETHSFFPILHALFTSFSPVAGCGS